MRYKLASIKKVKELQEGDIRIKNTFLLFPKYINREWRWLEKAKWRERVYLKYHCTPESKISWYAPAWTVDEWV